MGKLRSWRRAATPRKGGEPMTPHEVEMSEKDWRERLDPERFEVLRLGATEPAFSGELLHVDEDGMFTCAGCGAALFSAKSKFDSGSGWPSFDRAVADGRVDEHTDRSFGMVRTEITCARCGGHLGHVFHDGPTQTGDRYCINSCSLAFEPATASEEQGGAGAAPGGSARS